MRIKLNEHLTWPNFQILNFSFTNNSFRIHIWFSIMFIITISDDGISEVKPISKLIIMWYEEVEQPNWSVYYYQLPFNLSSFIIAHYLGKRSWLSYPTIQLPRVTTSIFAKLFVHTWATGIHLNYMNITLFNNHIMCFFKNV